MLLLLLAGRVSAVATGDIGTVTLAAPTATASGTPVQAQGGGRPLSALRFVRDKPVLPPKPLPVVQPAAAIGAMPWGGRFQAPGGVAFGAAAAVGAAPAVARVTPPAAAVGIKAVPARAGLAGPGLRLLTKARATGGDAYARARAEDELWLLAA